MILIKIEEEEVNILEGVEVSIDDNKVKVRGPKGELIRSFDVNMIRENNRIKIWALNPKRREAAKVKTIAAHIRNMMKGVKEGFTYKLKIVYVHFPISVKVEGDRVIIQNFLGERKPREAKIVGNTKVTVKGDDIIVEGINIEDVGQTAANIQQATKTKEKDPRKFIDGIYVYEKS
jgi:large subunit ribosomal protein L6